MHLPEKKFSWYSIVNLQDYSTSYLCYSDTYKAAISVRVTQSFHDRVFAGDSREDCSSISIKKPHKFPKLFFKNPLQAFIFLLCIFEGCCTIQLDRGFVISRSAVRFRLTAPALSVTYFLASSRFFALGSVLGSRMHPAVFLQQSFIDIDIQ